VTVSSKDTEALVGDIHVPEVDTEVISGDERLLVAVDRHRIDVVGVRVGKHPSGTGFDHGL
jgi:hypothetical protein